MTSMNFPFDPGVFNQLGVGGQFVFNTQTIYRLIGFISWERSVITQTYIQFTIYTDMF